MAEHTPTPWKVFSKNGILAILAGKTESEVVHWSGFDAASFDDATNRANAAFIVKAVNSHDAIVAALSELYAQVRGECPSLLNEDSGGDARLHSEIQAVLAAAGGAS